jgi:putative redox protein
MAATVKKPQAIVELVWEHDLVFGGRSGEICMTLDSAAREGPSPVQALVFALAGCMAMDVVHILKKGRHDLRGLRADLVGERAQEEPRRVIAVDVRFTITGNVPGDLVQRAIDLSREKYCSVWHSMRQDIPMTTSFQVTSGL